jgi:hypothetical protein
MGDALGGAPANPRLFANALLGPISVASVTQSRGHPAATELTRAEWGTAYCAPDRDAQTIQT